MKNSLFLNPELPTSYAGIPCSVSCGPFFRPVGIRQYELTDHLGNVMVTTPDYKLENVVSGRFEYYANYLDMTDYYPFGYPIAERSWTGDDYRFGFNGQEKDDEIYGEGSALSFEFRMYDSRLGRFWSVDLFLINFPSKTPYHYCSNDPINRIDLQGNWDVTVHLYSDRAQHGYGIAIVTDRNGNEVFRFDVRAEGTAGRNRNSENADTPLGVYDIPDELPWLSGGSRASYGPNERLNMVGQSGEIITSERDLIRIHGGRQEVYDSKTKTWTVVENPELKKTNGCLRAFDVDMVTFKQIVDGLQAQDTSELPGVVNVLGNLEQVVVPSSTGNMIEVRTEYRVPVQNTIETLMRNILNYSNNQNNSTPE